MDRICTYFGHKLTPTNQWTHGEDDSNPPNKKNHHIGLENIYVYFK